MKKKKLKVLKKLSKDQLIDDLLKKTIKGGCCDGSSRISMVDDDEGELEPMDFY